MTKKDNCSKGYSCSAACIARNKECNVEATEGTPAHSHSSWLDKAIHGGDHLGESVVAWKVGKVAGGAIAAAAISHGAPAIATAIIAESVIQGATATAIHYAKHKDDITAKQVAAYFVRQTAAGLAGKNAHTAAHLGVEALKAAGIYEKAIPLVSGKLAGIGTAATAANKKLDERFVNTIIDRSRADIAKVNNFFARLTLFARLTQSPAADMGEVYTGVLSFAKLPELEKFEEEEIEALGTLTAWVLTVMGITENWDEINASEDSEEEDSEEEDDED